jgi:fused signal recognition particle receptor
MCADIKKGLSGKRVKRAEIESEIRAAIKESLEDVLSRGGKSIDLIEEIRKAEKPYKIAFVGINGTGKTTTIAKLAYLLKEQGLEPVIAASDTFRAASIEQLEQHTNKIGVKLIKHKYGADAAAVAFDAVEHAKAKGKAAVLIDTAGRMQTNINLMDELKKIIRVIKPDLVIFVGDSLTGNDAIEQARTFNEARVDAIILTKADADAKGGACLSIAYEIGKPILYLGTGQNYPDLTRFTPEWFIEKVTG